MAKKTTKWLMFAMQNNKNKDIAVVRRFRTAKRTLPAIRKEFLGTKIHERTEAVPIRLYKRMPSLAIRKARFKLTRLR